MNNMNKSLLMSFEEYSSILNKHTRPYFYSIKSSNQFLYYFGSKHTYDPTHPQFELLQKEWSDFLQKTSGAKSVVIFEGIANINNQATQEEVIKKYGESGAIVFMSSKENIPCIRPEPTVEYEVEKLLNEFSKEEVFYFYIIRGIVTWQRTVVKKEFDEYITLNIKRYQDILKWESFDFSFDAIKKIHGHIFGKEFDLSDKEYIAKIPSPSFKESRINEIARMSSMIRNIAILDCIEKYWMEGNNIFVVYGANHAVMQEPAIKSLV